MNKNIKRVIFCVVLIIIFCITLPLFTEYNIFGYYPFKNVKLYFSCEDNKSYFQVMLSGIAILITFLLFYWQNQIELSNKNKEIKQEREKSEQHYIEQREREYAGVRPMFLVELEGQTSRVKTFIRENAPLTNVTVYYQNFVEESFKEEFIGNATSGDIIFNFDSDRLESAIIKCRTYLEEDIYFQYHAGNNLLHYRIIDGQDVEYIKNVLRRRILNESIDSVLNNMIEIYGIQLQYPHHESIYIKKFIDFFINYESYSMKFSTENKLLYSSIILEQNNIEEILNRAIDINARIVYKKTPEIFIELLGIVNKYLKHFWYTNCKEVEKEEQEYFINNIRGYKDTELEKYIEIFDDESINRETITRYIDDLIIYLTNSRELDEYAMRNVEVYVRDYVTISEERLGYSNEIEYANEQVKNELRKVISKYI